MFRRLFDNLSNLNRIALTEGSSQLTYAEAGATIGHLASELTSRGASGSSIVTYEGGLGMRAFLVFLACQKIGCAFFALDPKLTPSIRQHLAGMLRVDMVIGAAWVDDAIARAHGITTQPSCAANLPEHVDDGYRPCFITTTSGSTGIIPRILHRNVHRFCRQAETVRDELAMTCDDVLLHPYTNWFDCPTAVLATGGRVVFLDLAATSTNAAFDTLRAHRVTLLALYPALFEVFAQSDTGFDALRVVLLCGDRLTGSDLAAFKRMTSKGCRLINCYGSQEAGYVSRSTYKNESSLDEHQDVLLGRPFPSVTVELLAEDGRLIEATTTAQTGEMRVRSDQVAEGYVLSRESLFSQRDIGPVAHLTGDLASWTRSGELSFAGRTRQITKVLGHKVSAAELEAEFRKCPGVEDAAVILDRTQRHSGRIFVFFSGACRDEELRRFAEVSLPYYQMPHAVMKVAALPRTATGKIAYATLQASIEETDVPLGLSPRVAAIFSVYKEYASRSDWRFTDSFFDIGGDSLSFLRLQLDIEKVVRGRIDWDAFLLAGASLQCLIDQIESGSRHPRMPSPSRSVFVMPMYNGILPALPEILAEVCGDLVFRGSSSVAPARFRTFARHNARGVLEDFNAQGGRTIFGYSAGGSAAIELAALLHRSDLELILVEPWLHTLGWRSYPFFARALLSPVMPDMRVVLALKDRNRAWDYLWKPKAFACHRVLLVYGPEYPTSHLETIKRLATGEITECFINAPHGQLVRGEHGKKVALAIRQFLN